MFRPDEARATSISRSGSVRSEQRSLGEKDLPPSGLRPIWPVASLLVGHSPTAGGCSLLAPRHRPNWAQRTSSDFCLRPLRFWDLKLGVFLVFGAWFLVFDPSVPSAPAMGLHC